MVSTRGSKYKFTEGEKVLCYEPDPAKTKVLYNSKVLGYGYEKDFTGKKALHYLIHFQGWNSTWDRFVTEDYILKDTEENRKLQKELAEKAQLTAGGNLYRKGRKKRTLSRTGSDNGESKKTAESDGEVGGGGGREAAYSAGLRTILETDYQRISQGKVCVLPAHPNVVEVLQKFMREYIISQIKLMCHKRGHLRPTAGKYSYMTISEIVIRANICREVVDGIRLYLDFMLDRTLLYNLERAQHRHFLLGQIRKYPPPVRKREADVSIKNENMIEAKRLDLGIKEEKDENEKKDDTIKKEEKEKKDEKEKKEEKVKKEEKEKKEDKVKKEDKEKERKEDKVKKEDKEKERKEDKVKKEEKEKERKEEKVKKEEKERKEEKVKKEERDDKEKKEERDRKKDKERRDRDKSRESKGKERSNSSSSSKEVERESRSSRTVKEIKDEKESDKDRDTERRKSLRSHHAEPTTGGVGEAKAGGEGGSKPKEGPSCGEHGGRGAQFLASLPGPSKLHLKGGTHSHHDNGAKFVDLASLLGKGVVKGGENLMLRPMSQREKDILRRLVVRRIVPEWFGKTEVAGAPPPPSTVYGAVHLARALVKIPEMFPLDHNENKMAVLNEYLNAFTKFLENHPDWFDESHYKENKYDETPETSIHIQSEE